MIPGNKFRSRDERFGDRVEKRHEENGKVVTEDFRYNRETDEYLCPEGRILLKEMRDKIDSHEGRRKYSKRMGIIEPVFGNITANKGMNYFTMRGEKKVNIQWMLYALVHNIEKLATTGAVARMGVA